MVIKTKVSKYKRVTKQSPFFLLKSMSNGYLEEIISLNTSLEMFPPVIISAVFLPSKR